MQALRCRGPVEFGVHRAQFEMGAVGERDVQAARLGAVAGGLRVGAGCGQGSGRNSVGAVACGGAGIGIGLVRAVAVEFYVPVRIDGQG